MTVPVSDSTSLGDPSAGPGGRPASRGWADDLGAAAAPAWPRLGDRIFASAVRLAGLAVAAAPALMLIALVVASIPSIRRTGLSFLTSSRWDSVHQHFGALPFIYGTVVSSLLGLFLAVVVSVPLAIFLSDLAPARLRRPLGFVVELLAAIPSVVYGFWGIFVLVPLLREKVEPFLGARLGFLPLFRGEPFGYGMLAAGIVLAIMIVPTITSISREVLRAVPDTHREAALGLGATPWDVIRVAVLPAARSGIAGAVILGLNRAIGETMAVTMVIGNGSRVSASLFQPANSMASVLANQFADADSDAWVAALCEVALLLLGVTLVMNLFARGLVHATKQRTADGTAARVSPPPAAPPGHAGVESTAEIYENLRVLSTSVARAEGAPARPRDEVLPLEPTRGETFRHMKSRFYTGLTALSAVVVLAPLLSILFYIVRRGLPGLSLSFFVHRPVPVGVPGGGMANAVLGTLELIVLACLIGLPIGVGAGIYLAEVGRGRAARGVRFMTDVLAGVPSIVVGVFVNALLVRTMHGFSAIAGAVALSVVMIPTVTRTSEELLRLVPPHLREAALGLGVSSWRATLFVVVRTALPGIGTGVMLAVARIAGETAPLLFTAFGNDYVSVALDRPIAALPMQIFNYARTSYKDWQDQAWTGALVLVALVLLLNLTAQLAAARGAGVAVRRPLGAGGPAA